MVDISSSRLCPRPARRTVAAALSGIGLGVAVGLAALALLTGLALGGAAHAPSADPGRLIDAAHVPPLLTAAGERVRLRYDIYCTAPDGDPDSGAPCDAEGTVYIRSGSSGPFRALPLHLDPDVAEGRYVADVPEKLASAGDGFAYYAVLRNRRSGAALTLPPGGSAAPQRSVPLGRAVTVDLGAHVFGATRGADARVFSARWGRGPGEAGLESGPETAPTGPGAFDVAADGTVTVLDQVNRRALRLQPDGGRPDVVPLAVSGALADLAVDDAGAMHVLESAAAAGPRPVVRSFDATGAALGGVAVAARTAAQVRIGPDGPIVKEYPGEQWVAARPGTVRGRAARPLADGREVVVLRVGDEVRLALVDRHGARRSWVVHSATALGEVQLAEPLDNRLVAVFRVYEESRDEFVVVVLGARGVERRFSVGSADWAEAAALSRFRLAGGALYQLGSTPAGAHVDRFDLEAS